MGPKTLRHGWSDAVDSACGCEMDEAAEKSVHNHTLALEEQDRLAAEIRQKPATAQAERCFKEEMMRAGVPQE
jgi:hypothetical protein